VGTTCGVTIRLEGVRGRVRFTAEFLDPGGERRARVQRWGEGGGTMLFDGQFTQAGRGRVVVRGVSDQGVSAQAEMEVEITP
jgi:hypothetical protein